MPDAMRYRGTGKLVRVLLAANLCLWIYFSVGFAHASHRYEPNHLGHPSGTGYTFWGHSIALTESGLVYPFFKVTFYTELPSFVVAVLIERAFDSQLISHRFVEGISIGGWSLVGTVLLSFFQWYLIGWIVQKLWHRCFGHIDRLSAPLT